jgi:hypothetical protein
MLGVLAASRGVLFPSSLIGKSPMPSITTMSSFNAGNLPPSTLRDYSVLMLYFVFVYQLYFSTEIIAPISIRAGCDI